MTAVTCRKENASSIRDVIVLVVKLLNLTRDPAICCMCLNCIANIVCLDAGWTEPVLDTGIISIITNFEDVVVRAFT